MSTTATAPTSEATAHAAAPTLTPFASANLTRQGFCGLDDATKARLNLALRFTPAVCLVLAAVAVATAAAWLLGLLALGALVGAATGRHPFDVVYDRTVRRAIGGPSLPPARRPRRFAFALAASVLTGAAVAFALGATAVATVVGLVQIAGCAVYVTTGWCPGSSAHQALFGSAETQASGAEPEVGIEPTT